MTKEILKDELLKEEQLENVAGGTNDETYKDMGYLHDYCHVNFDNNNWDRSVGKLGELFRRAGMRLDTSERHGNRYYEIRNGREERIDRSDALYRLGAAINAGRVDTNVW